MKSASPHAARGFTLIELLTVIAVIGILAAIIIPTTGAVRTSAKKAQTKSQFSQWAQSMVLYKQEYGFFPPINRAAYANPDPNKLNSTAFAAALTGRQLSGAAISDTPANTFTARMFGNKKRSSFYSLANSDLNEARDSIVDAFGNTDIVVVYDKNGDGMITNDDYDNGVSTMPRVRAIGAVADLPAPTPTRTIAATEGPRASVVFYSAGKGEGVNDIIYSWE